MRDCVLFKSIIKNFIILMPDNTFTKARKEIKDWLKRCLVGPFYESNEQLNQIRPSSLYSCGILYGHMEDPSNEWFSPDDSVGSSVDDLNDQADEKPVFGVEESPIEQNKAKKASSVCRYRPPSAVGLSFFVNKNIVIEVLLKAARYTKEPGQTWERCALPDDNPNHEDCIILKVPENDQQLNDETPIPILHHQELEQDNQASAQLHVKWRPYPDNNHQDGYILTVSIVNCAVAKKINPEAWEKTHLFQLSFDCHIQAGTVLPYPGNEIDTMAQEDKEFELLYADKTVYAIGHGVSPDWSENNGCITSIKACFIPSYEVPLMKTDVGVIDNTVLQLSCLAKTEHQPKTIQKNLTGFTKAYETWIAGLYKESKALPLEQQNTAFTMLKRLEKTAQRMNQGTNCLNDPMVAKAFSFAHEAMLSYMQTRKVKKPLWRPFQLGFLLLTLPSLIDENNPDRDLVDLLWFQTGGGKTEAYLAIIAFLVTYRRMRFPQAGAGTTVIMRYTLRLLTIQQFQRASILMCALELLRRKNPQLLGSEPITAGLWVGGASSPNNFKDAEKILDDALQGNGTGLEKFVVTQCPWCGKKLSLNPDISKSGFCANKGQFYFCCTNSGCDFGGSTNPVLPINVVDEHLYQHPPTLLLATIDKFAMFAWNKDTTIFLGNASRGTGPFRPPDLIIQDELHLIAGELGTIAGVYEAGFDTVLRLKDHCPKYIASTATIRNAKEQVKKLYARDVNIFPSPGLNWKDSFFARVDKEKPGRLYLGYYSPGLKRTESFAPLGAALLLSPSLWNYSDESIQDAWWTLVAYHGSLRGLGITHNLIGDDVRKYLELYIRRLLDDEQGQTDPLSRGFHEFCRKFKVSKNDDDRERKIINAFLNTRRLYTESGIAELTSNRNANEIRKYLDDLEIPYSEENNQAICVLLCTNMVSVGLDISRLGLMVINGQPFTTGEYIQAGSRVGRNNVPGIVVTHYFRNHARDMSHFENFKAYHQSFYRFVEPTSLTPFSSPARKRALHAALVIVMRHGAGLMGNNMANQINLKDDKIRHAAFCLTRRCSMASPQKGKTTKEHIENLLYEWNDMSGGDGLFKAPLQYQSHSKDKKPLLKRHNEKKMGQTDDDSWVTLQSMRQVDDECGIYFMVPR
ncbi:Helicase conserved C-terminal domain-containing protein [Desulfobacula phenolica]|uniref:Helicase conserved C-terminal domain-containing protein n=2 Tax=Desulfobacula phenolica TaxID=90732 RepID=A0A1H2DM56_9BACT|nr:Helicase conserved C-terminal domain-containing protein [Desulfobacula phenolica]